MSARGPILAEGEAQGVIDFIIKRANLLKTNKFSITLDELKPLLIGATEEGHYANRIRWRMKDELDEAGIQFRFNGDSYKFTIEDSNIFQNTTSQETTPKIETVTKVKTTTEFKHQYFPAPWFSDVVTCLQNGAMPLLVGPRGCGKSRALEEAFARVGRKSYRFSLAEFSDPAALIGEKDVIEENGVPVTKFTYGPLTETLTSECGIIFDEMDSLHSGLVLCLNKILEQGTKISLPTEKGIVEVPRHPQSLIAATANTWGYGDDTGDYIGTKPQNRALWDRFFPKIEWDYHHPTEAAVLRTIVPEKIVNALYSNILGQEGRFQEGLIILLRNAIKDPANPLEDTLSFRSVLSFGENWRIFGWHKALFYFLCEFRPENRESVFSIIRNRFGQDLIPSRNHYDSNQTDYIPNLSDEMDNI